MHIIQNIKPRELQIILLQLYFCKESSVIIYSTSVAYIKFKYTGGDNRKSVSAVILDTSSVLLYFAYYIGYRDKRIDLTVSTLTGFSNKYWTAFLFVNLVIQLNIVSIYISNTRWKNILTPRKKAFDTHSYHIYINEHFIQTKFRKFE